MSTQFASTWCDNIGPCCRAASIAFDAAACKMQAKASLDPEFARYSSPNVKYDPAAAGRCLAAYAKVLQRCAPASEINDSVSADCQATFTGTVPANAACSFPQECAMPAGAQVSCETPTSQGTNSQQICLVRSGAPHGKLGEACSSTCPLGDSCSSLPSTSTVVPVETVCFADDGLQCEVSSSTCQPLRALGQPCTVGACAAGAYCGSASVCVARQPDGASCTSYSSCMHDSCVFADSASSTGTCAVVGVASAKNCAGELD